MREGDSIFLKPINCLIRKNQLSEYGVSQNLYSSYAEHEQIIDGFTFSSKSFTITWSNYQYPIAAIDSNRKVI